MLVDNIEDLLIAIHQNKVNFDKKALSEKDRSILFSMSSQLYKKNLALTENQANLAVKILKSNEILMSDPTMKKLVDEPVYKLPFRFVDKSKKISICNIDGKEYIHLKYPFSRHINSLVEKMDKSYNPSPEGVVVRLNGKSLKFIIDNFLDFELDSKMSKLIEKTKEILKNPTPYLPSISIKDGKFEFSNLPKSLSTYIESQSPKTEIETLFLAKNSRIFFDDTVIKLIKNLPCSELTKNYLLYENVVGSSISHRQQDIINMINDLKSFPILMTIKESTNLYEKIKNWIEEFYQIGIKNTEISVLFRSDTDKDFNNYIKEQQLNNLVDENTKIVIVNYKIPKILYKINFKPTTILSTSFVTMHYTMRSLIKSHPFVLCGDSIEKFDNFRRE